MYLRSFISSFVLLLDRNPESMWKKIEDAIRSIILLKEPFILRVIKTYRSKRNFFEMIRFDFTVDNDLNVFVMEVRILSSLQKIIVTPDQKILNDAYFSRLICHQIYLQVIFHQTD